MSRLIQTLSVQNHFREMSPNLIQLLVTPLEFGRLTVIIGDNGSGKSQLISMLCAAVSHKQSKMLVRHLPYPVYHDYAEKGYISVEMDKEALVLYHQGVDPAPLEPTTRSRIFGSNGEGVLFDLLICTTDILKYCPYLNSPGVSGIQIIEFKRDITRRFIYGPPLDLVMRSSSVLISDEPELGLSPKRVKAIFQHFLQWLERGNQLILTTNHPWMVNNWPPSVNARIVDLDRYESSIAASGFSYVMT